MFVGLRSFQRRFGFSGGRKFIRGKFHTGGAENLDVVGDVGLG